LDRGRLAGVRGHGVSAWLAALPNAGLTGTLLPVPFMRVAVRLWLGVPPVATYMRLCCVCVADVDPHGALFVGDCSERAPGRTRRHSRILYLVRDALAASPEWTDVVLEQAVEADVDAGARGVRFDVRAARVGSGALAWGDMSVAATLSSKLLERVAADPGVAEAAVRREAQKVAKYGHRELHLSLFLILWHAPRLFVALCTLFLFFSYSRSLKTPALQRSQKCSKSASAGS